MSETRFTPGPWSAFMDDSGSAPHTNIVAVVPRTACVFSLPGRRKSDADVKLIASAPDLYAALDGLIASIDGTSPEWFHEEHADAIKEARAALSKARGES